MKCKKIRSGSHFFGIIALLLVASSNLISYTGSFWLFGEPDIPESLLK